ncbi:DMT family transporter [Ammoniphilus resinae]|nr:EamA family transporter [Ammoniphilus resinae]
MLLLFSIFTGATFNLAKYTVEYFSAISAAAWRFGLASLIMIIILIVKERKKLKLELLKQNGLSYIILGIIGIFGFNALFFFGMKFTSAINGALIMATNPLVTTILSRIILNTSITKHQGVGVGFSLIGVVLVITQGSSQVISQLSFSIGDLLILGGNICWSLYGVLGRRYIKNSSTLSTTTFTMVIGTVFLIIVSTFNPNPIPLDQIPHMAWWAIGFMSIFTTVLGYLFWNQGISEIGTSKTSIFFNLVPVVTMVISFALGDKVTWIQVMGTILVISGVVISSNIQLKRKNEITRLNKGEVI